MALKIDNQNNLLEFTETTEPGTPPAGKSYVYVKSDGRIYVKDEAGTESQPGITEIVEDTTPTLGGTLASGGNNIEMADGNRLYMGTSNKSHIYHSGTLFELASGTGDMSIRNTSPDGLIEFFADNTSSIARRMLRIGPTGSNSVELGLYWNSSLKLLTTTNGVTITGGISLSGGSVTTDTLNGDITLTPNGTGNVLLGNFEFDADQTVGAGQDNFVLTYDNGTGHIGLEALAAGGLFTEDADNNIIGGTGAGAGLSATFGVDNFFAGVNAGTTITTGDNNVVIGNNSLTEGTNVLGGTAIGVNAAKFNTGSYNVAVGFNSLFGVTATSTAGQNVSVGVSSGYKITTGGGNTLIGYNSGFEITTGEMNVCIGDQAGPTISNPTLSNKLYINTSKSDAPLIGGDFVTKEVEFVAGKVSQKSKVNDGREITYILTNTTSNDTETNLYIDGTTATEQIPIPDEASWLVEVSIVGKDTGGTRDAYYKLEFALQRSSGFSQQRGSTSKTTFFEFSAGYDCDIFVNNTSDILEVRVTGDSTIEMDWVATVRITEIIAPT